MKYLLKQSIVPFVYLAFADMLGLSIMVLAEKHVLVGILLYSVNLIFYGAMLFATSFKDGEKALDVRETNDRHRELIVKTGENISLNLAEEFKVWKGFAYGFITSVPVIILLVFHTISILAGGGNTIGVISGVAYMPFYSYFLSYSAGTSYSYYFALIACLALPIMTGIPYWLGARKAELKYLSIRESQEILHGEK